MKNTFLLLLGVLAASAFAQETARVLASTAIVQQVAVPRQVCTQETVAVQAPKTGAGAVMGAIAGGVIGNQIGNGSGRAAATAVGLIGGAFVGDRIEGAPPTQTQQVQTCRNETVFENRVVGYQVTYEYAGKQYMVQMPQDPGPTLRVNVTPVLN
jgi:uncharacterized protein YcfJ